MTRPNRLEVLELLRRIEASPLGDRLILAGSSGVYGVSETIPALTEDVDVLVDADWIAAEEGAVLEHMRQLGFQHQRGTPTFTSAAGSDVMVAGPQAAGYAGMQQSLEQGLTVLQRLAGHAEEHP